MKESIPYRAVFITVLVFATYVIAVFLEIATVGAVSGALIVLMSPAVVVTFLAFYEIGRLRETSTEQQKQIADLTRELEEVKRKLEK